jgi:hypothetical protein
MDDQRREPLRQHVERALDTLDRMRQVPRRRALHPVPVALGPVSPQRTRPVRPIRAWSRLIRI